MTLLLYPTKETTVRRAQKARLRGCKKGVRDGEAEKQAGRGEESNRGLEEEESERKREKKSRVGVNTRGRAGAGGTAKGRNIIPLKGLPHLASQFPLE